MPLDRDEVLAGAQRLVDEVGLDGLTMRRLADALSVQAGAIYWHFANKQALVDAMTDDLLCRVLESPLKGAWDQQLAELCRRIAAGLLGRRDGARLATSAVKPGPHALAASEAMMRVAKGAGLPRKTTLWATAVLGYYVLGYVADVQAMEAAKTRGLASTMKALKKELKSNKYPELARLEGRLEALMSGASFRERFEFGLEVIFRGLKSHRRGAAVKVRKARR